MYDEYTGSAGGAECVGGTTSSACVMEAGWTDGDRFGNSATGGALVAGRVNEFCVASNHDPDGDTSQDEIHGASCWETMHSTFPGLAIPGGTPTQAAPGGRPPIDWIVLVPEQRYVLVLDRSGSMQGNKLDQALIGSAWWADNARNGDRLGVVSFASSAGTNIGLTTIAGDPDRTAVQAAISGIAASGRTAIGDGLRQGLGEILAAGARAATQVLVLLTDGLHNEGEDPRGVLPDLSANGVRVYTIGVGPSIDSVLLQDIASDTGGTYYRIDPTLSSSAQEFRIRTVLQEISGVARENGGVVTTRPENLGREKPVTRRILIEEGSESATFAITWVGSPDAVEIELDSPDGEHITLGSLPPNVRAIATGFPYTGFQVERPTPGEWRITMRAPSGVGGPAQLLVLSENPRIDGALFSPTKQYAPGDVIRLYLQAYVDQPITGIQVSGIAILPDGSQAPLRFGDDGDPLTGDAIAKDGTYSALFDETHDAEGIYTFLVDITSDGFSVSYPEAGELLRPGDVVASAAIPAFERRLTFAVTVGREKFIEPEIEEER